MPEPEDEKPFLTMIREDPLDETNRLVFADWLEERGHTERAIFYRAGLIPLTPLEMSCLLRLTRKRSGIPYRGSGFLHAILDEVKLGNATVIRPSRYKLLLFKFWRSRARLPRDHWEICPQWTRKRRSENPTSPKYQ